MQAGDLGCTTGTLLLMGLNILRRKVHCVSTDLGTCTLMYVLIFILSGGVLPWQHMDLDDLTLTSLRYAAMAPFHGFLKGVLCYIPRQCWDVVDRLRNLLFTPDYKRNVKCADFMAQLQLWKGL